MHYYVPVRRPFYLDFCFNNPATTEIYTLSLHDALPISQSEESSFGDDGLILADQALREFGHVHIGMRERSEEHTSELQSPVHLVCRLLLEKKKADLRLTLRLSQQGFVGDPDAQKRYSVA